MRLFKGIIISCLFLSSALIYAESITIPLTIRHIGKYAYQDMSDNNGKVGAYERGNTAWPFSQFSHETLLFDDLAALNGTQATDVTLRFYADSLFTQHYNEVVNLYENNKGPFSTTAVYNTYALTQWNHYLGNIQSSSSAEGWKEISTTELTTLVQEWVAGSTTNNGLVLSGAFVQYEYFWTITQAELIVEFDQTMVNLTVNTEGNGTVTPPGGSFPQGSDVTLTATPGEDYKFDHWSGDTSGTNPNIIITMDSDKNVTAHFVEDIVEYTVTIAIHGDGDVTLSPSGGTYSSGTVVQINANANTGSHFEE